MRRNDELLGMRFLQGITDTIKDQINKKLDAHDKELVKIKLDKYKQYTEGVIEDIELQNKAIASAIKKPTGIWTGELGPGVGKTIIAARIAAEYFLEKGNIIYICHSKAALGDERDGIINKIHKVFSLHNIPHDAIGRCNERNAQKRIIFLTSFNLVKMYLSKERRDLLNLLLSRCSLIILDETHHYPKDRENRLKIFGKVEEIIYEFAKNKKVIGITATHKRGDKLLVLGKLLPDFKFTIQNAVDEGRCPEIYGQQVFVSVKKRGSIYRTGDFLDIRLSPKERRKYLNQITDCMVEVWKRYPVPTCAFVRTIADAKEVVRLFNLKSGLGNRGLAKITSEETIHQRQEIISKINRGKMLGFVTCQVAEEAIDIPSLEIVHLIRRTHSWIRLTQAVGRALRICVGKRRVLVIDYHIANETIINACLGLSDFGDVAESTIPKEKRGRQGGLLVRRSDASLELIGLSLDEEKALILKQQFTNSTAYKCAAIFMLYALNGKVQTKLPKFFDTDDPLTWLTQVHPHVAQRLSQEYYPKLVNAVGDQEKVLLIINEIRQFLKAA